MQATSSFGQWLKHRRLSLDLTQEELAEAISCSVDQIRKIEYSLRKPSRQVAELLATYLQVPQEEHPDLIKWARGPLDRPPPPFLTEPLSKEPRLPSGTPTQDVQDRLAGRRLPVPPTPLVGRERELEQGRALLRRASTRVVTLTGPPGTGKTRLALALASSVEDDLRDGVLFVPLASLSDPALVLVTVAKLLGVVETPLRRLVVALADYLQDKQMLILLDNFEQVAEAAPLIAELIQAAPPARLLVTSRTALHIRGEKVLAIPPLAVPDIMNITESDQSLDELAKVESVALFVERAQDALSDFTITQANAHVVAEICDRLEGLPLAIELAAARLRLLTPSDLLARLEQQLAILSGGPRDMATRHKTLHGAIASSYDLLSNEEQALFRKLGVFAGSFTIGAAEALTGAELDAFASLVDQSLLRRLDDARSHTGKGDEARFGMLAAIREYALEMLALAGDGEAENTKRQHTAYYLALAEFGSTLPGIPAQYADWLARLEQEQDNLRAALSWSLDNKEEDIALRLVRALGQFWWARGHLVEGRRWVEAALALGRTAPASLRAPALREAMRLALAQSDFVQVKVFAEEVLLLDRTSGDKKGEGMALSSLGVVASEQHDYPQALARFEESLSTYREIGDTQNQGIILSNMGFLAMQEGDYERSAQLCEESLAIHRARGDIAFTTSSLVNLGLACLHQGNYALSSSLHHEALALARESHNKRYSAQALTYLGLAASRQGDWAQVAGFYKEALSLMRELGSNFGIARDLVGLAGFALSQEHPAPTIRILSAARTRLDAERQELTPAERDLYEQTLQGARSILSVAAFTLAWAEGRTITLEDALSSAFTV